jgi:hypothetical protein
MRKARYVSPWKKEDREKDASPVNSCLSPWYVLKGKEKPASSDTTIWPWRRERVEYEGELWLEETPPNAKASCCAPARPHRVRLASVASPIRRRFAGRIDNGGRAVAHAMQDIRGVMKQAN